jgi:murein L,D-transpeptidase YcbB/YkuD
MEGAAERGLDPADYDTGWLRGQAQAIPGGADCGVFDVGLSLNYLRFLSHAATGRVDPRRLGFDYRVERRLEALGDVLRVAIDQGAVEDVAGLADRLEPSWPQFRRLKSELERYRSLAAREGFRPLSDTRRLAPGDPYRECELLARRLEALGDLEDRGPIGERPSFSECTGALAPAIRQFQARHGITPDGILGPKTLRQLNVPLTDRARQIELAMERLRWLPRAAGALVVVNVPAYRLVAFRSPEDPRPVLQMAVIVGRAAGSRTPLFAAAMRDVVFRPFWYPPQSIVQNEILPRLLEDPSALAANDMEVVAELSEHAAPQLLDQAALDGLRTGRLRLRQRPGPGNSLGLVKFDFPNDHTVYMHGTSAPQLFGRARRDLSHGCVRVADPAGLAEFVIDDPEWPRERIEAVMEGSLTFHLPLAHPISVFVFYTTAVVRADGTLSLFDDLYGEDRVLARALARRQPRP